MWSSVITMAQLEVTEMAIKKSTKYSINLTSNLFSGYTVENLETSTFSDTSSFFDGEERVLFLFQRSEPSFDFKKLFSLLTLGNYTSKVINK